MGPSYLQPLGLLAGVDARAAREAGLALPLAGGPLAFTQVARIARGPRPGARETEILPVSGFGALSDREALARLTASRAPLAGVPLDRPRIMGVVNVTPDSFSDGGDFLAPAAAIAQGLALAEAGADWLDLGAESTRPGAEPTPAEDEIARLLPVIEGLVQAGAPPISVDSRKPEVMRATAKAGAAVLNDVSALGFAPDSAEAAAATGLPVILMHARADPATMQNDPRYDDVVLDIYDYLAARLEAARAAGVSPSRIVIDPGIGFGKTLAHNLALIRGLGLFHGLGVGLLLGVSRKRFIGAVTGVQAPKDRLAGSLAAALEGARRGAQILRVHDVAETRQAVDIARAVAAAE